MKSSKCEKFVRLTSYFVIGSLSIAIATSTNANPITPTQDVPDAKGQIEDQSSTHSRHISAEIRLLKSQIIDNIECHLTAGYGNAREIGVVEIPRGDGTDFAVLNPTGTVFSGTLPFHPTWTRIGAGQDDSIVVGFAELRGGGWEFKPPDAPEPIRILRGNETIFESEKVWDFDVAADASSFFVHQPGPNGTSKLIVRNLSTDEEVHHDLGTRFTPVNAYESDYMPKYSIDFNEAVFIPAYADARGIGKHWFYPVSEGKNRRITVENVLSALSANSKEWYFVEYPADRSVLKDDRIAWPVYRKQLDPARNEEKVIWHRMIELEHFNGSMELSLNGKWLGLSAWNYVVLDTQTGETRFEFQTVHDNEGQLARLRPVLPADATVSEIGSLGSGRFLGDYVLFYSNRGNATACSRDRIVPYNRTTYRTCLREQRLQNKYRWFHYVFDMNNVSIDSSPIFRREFFRDTECSIANSPLPGLRVNNGVLAYGSAS